MTESEPLAYQLEQAFRLLGVGRSKGFQLINADDLTSYKIGRRRYVTRKALETYIAKKEQEQGSKAA